MKNTLYSLIGAACLATGCATAHYEARDLNKVHPSRIEDANLRAKSPVLFNLSGESRNNLSYEETKTRDFQTVRNGRLSRRKHLSELNKTYCQYFKDNLSFYVVCQKREFEAYVKYLIKTVIIERGR